MFAFFRAAALLTVKSGNCAWNSSTQLSWPRGAQTQCCFGIDPLTSFVHFLSDDARTHAPLRRYALPVLREVPTAPLLFRPSRREVDVLMKKYAVKKGRKHV